MPKRKILALWRDEKMNEEEARILRKPCAEIPAPFDAAGKKEIRTLFEAFMDRDDALGLAAPDTVELLHRLNGHGMSLPLTAITVDECARAIFQALHGAEGK